MAAGDDNTPLLLGSKSRAVILSDQAMPDEESLAQDELALLEMMEHEMVNGSGSASADAQSAAQTGSKAQALMLGGPGVNPLRPKLAATDARRLGREPKASTAKGTADVWSIDFCRRYFANKANQFAMSRVEFARSALNNRRIPNAVVTRNIPDSGNISIHIGNHADFCNRFLYLLHDGNAGVILIKLHAVTLPNEGDWSKTLGFWRVYTGEEACAVIDHEQDMYGQGQGHLKPGKRTFRHIMADDAIIGTITHHTGDNYYHDDIRKVIGVARWSGTGNRDPNNKKVLAQDAVPPGFYDKHPKADLIWIQHNVSETV
jgi:hypothetical protein